MNRQSIIVHGPQGCGKTHYAQALMNHFGCARRIDDFIFTDHAKLKRLATEKPTLFLTNESPSLPPARTLRHVRLLSFENAIREAGITHG